MNCKPRPDKSPEDFTAINSIRIDLAEHKALLDIFIAAEVLDAEWFIGEDTAESRQTLRLALQQYKNLEKQPKPGRRRATPSR